MKRNPHLATLKKGYLFPEIARRKASFLEKHPDAKLIDLGIGDTTLPLLPSIASAIEAGVKNLTTSETYTGYGHGQGELPLRQKIAKKLYADQFAPDEIFISDGAKCDIGRLQVLFGQDISIALQDPVYPVYVDGSHMQGVKHIYTLPCTPGNHFFPNLSEVPHVDLIYFCSPHNPTGVPATRKQLEELVKFAQKNGSIIIFDAAYAEFITSPDIPKSIYAIEGAEEVAIELNSFSKMAGFTGLRLGWTVVPNTLRYDGGEAIHADWQRITSTLFNGAANIIQAGGEAALDDSQLHANTTTYLNNARLLKKCLMNLGYKVYGGDHSPYLWVSFQPMSSWEAFQVLLDKHHIVAIPGSEFGPSGDGFIRMSAFAKPEEVKQVIKRLNFAASTV